jgi:hypothetical protein
LVVPRTRETIAQNVPRLAVGDDPLPRGQRVHRADADLGRVAGQLPGHDDREQFLAGINLILAGIAAVRDVS